ncbi:hypothetical protein OGATHE_000902 [Ogataea polymorpha]|uniref:RNA polymerase II degradation factor 1 n=1 Tax=Ogataea polymorpha TaxID=460523 RepID=A0A9P8PS61_9ASCO|nr:hypothetical protein KL908_002441 [Ogataea polymorpha]KAH3677428.1 hypothetical protein OGATHE_000902 [Ogataea polymorpha]
MSEQQDTTSEHTSKRGNNPKHRGGSKKNSSTANGGGLSPELKQKFQTLTEFFPDWTFQDFVTIQEEIANVDITEISEGILTGKIQKWDQVVKRDEKKKSQHTEEHHDEPSAPAPVQIGKKAHQQNRFVGSKPRPVHKQKDLTPVASKVSKQPAPSATATAPAPQTASSLPNQGSSWASALAQKPAKAAKAPVKEEVPSEPKPAEKPAVKKEATKEQTKKKEHVPAPASESKPLSWAAAVAPKPKIAKRPAQEAKKEDTAVSAQEPVAEEKQASPEIARETPALKNTKKPVQAAPVVLPSSATQVGSVDGISFGSMTLNDKEEKVTEQQAQPAQPAQQVPPAQPAQTSQPSQSPQNTQSEYSKNYRNNSHYNSYQQAQQQAQQQQKAYDPSNYYGGLSDLNSYLRSPGANGQSYDQQQYQQLFNQQQQLLQQQQALASANPGEMNPQSSVANSMNQHSSQVPAQPQAQAQAAAAASPVAPGMSNPMMGMPASYYPYFNYYLPFYSQPNPAANQFYMNYQGQQSPSQAVPPQQNSFGNSFQNKVYGHQQAAANGGEDESSKTSAGAQGAQQQMNPAMLMQQQYAQYQPPTPGSQAGAPGLAGSQIGGVAGAATGAGVSSTQAYPYYQNQYQYPGAGDYGNNTKGWF